MRANRAIELLQEGQPIYYTGLNSLSYEAGVKASQTWADYLMVEMEHGLYNVPGLHQFMHGLVEGGPTRSGHRTPTVITTLPAEGTNESVMRANAWMVKQVLACGVHGVLLCHAEDPGAVRAFVEAARYPFQSVGVGKWTGTRATREWRTGKRRRHLGSVGAGISDQSRCLAAQPGR